MVIGLFLFPIFTIGCILIHFGLKLIGVVFIVLSVLFYYI